MMAVSPAPATEPRTLLVVSGARGALPVIATARRLGLRVVVADGAHDAPGFRLADAGILAPTCDAEAAVAAARAYAATTRIDGVIAAGDGAWTVAAIAHALGLTGPSLEVAALDRLGLAERARAARIGVPWSASVADVAELAAYASGVDEPLVVMPVDGPGGVRLLEDVEPEWAFDFVAAASPSGRVMVQAVIPGPRVRTAAVIAGGRVVTLALADVFVPPVGCGTPFVVDHGHDLPSRLHVAVRERIDALVADVAARLGIARGVIDADVAIGRGVPMLVGLRPHLSGDAFWSCDVPRATGVEAVEAAIRLALGEDVPASTLRPRPGDAVARRPIWASPGTVTAVRGADEAASGPGIVAVQVDVLSGDRVCGHPGRRPVGFVVAAGQTREA